MLTILQFDAASASVLDRLLADDRLPNLAALRDRGTWHGLDAPATQLAAGAQYTLYSGVPIEEHGLFYPFQWDQTTQRAHYMEHFPAPTPVWERLAPLGVRTLAIDPYESRPPAQPVPGELVCGWQLHDRVVLRRWESRDGTAKRLERLFGPSQPVDEVFGLHRADEMLALRRRLLAAPGRVADAAGLILGESEFDLGWLTFNAAHVAGHQFFDLSQIDPAGLDQAAETVLAGTVDDVYVAIDAALGRIVGALPPNSDLMVISPVGMELNTSRADLLPEMLAAILDPSNPRAAAGDGDASGFIWRLRAALPADVRAKVAGALPGSAAVELTARLEMRGMDWSATKAFAHPAENQGYVRLNLAGRERDGIVPPDEADDLLDQIADGLRTFTDVDGAPAIASIRKTSEAFGSGSRSHMLPDLIVSWADRPATTLTALRSERYGEVRRHGVGSGRSGNHTEGDAWALVVPGQGRHAKLNRPPRLEDVAATALAMSGADISDMVGESLLEA